MNLRETVRRAVGKVLGAPEGNTNAAKDHTSEGKLTSGFREEQIKTLSPKMEKARQDWESAVARYESKDVIEHHRKQYEDLHDRIRRLRTEGNQGEVTDV